MKMPVRTIFVSVSQALDGKMANDIKPGITPLIDVARGCWVVDLNKANACDWLVAIYHSRVVGVYEIDKKAGWQVVKPGCIPTRNLTTGPKKRYYCKLKDLQGTIGKAYMNKVKRMFGAVQYS